MVTLVFPIYQDFHFYLLQDWNCVNRFHCFSYPIRAGAMTFNFWFLTGGKTAASTIQAIQRATGSAGPPDARPRAPLPIADRVETFMEESQQQPVIVAPTLQNLAPRRAPAPRPHNVEILTQRAKSVREEQKTSQKERSRSPQTVSSRITGAQDLPLPPQDLPQGSGIQLIDRFHNGFPSQIYKECGTHPLKRR